MGNIESEPYFSVADEKIKTFLLTTKQANVLNPMLEYYKQYVLMEHKEEDNYMTRNLLIYKQRRFSSLWNRQMIIQYFGYAIPDPQALSIIKEYTMTLEQPCLPRRVIEIGSGLGYWTYLLRQEGLQVDAVDTMEEFNQVDRYWIKDTIKADAVDYLKENNSKESVLLMVWPRSCEEFLEHFQGEYVILVGEGEMGCTGVIHERYQNSEGEEEGECDECGGACRSVWEGIRSYNHPTWPALHDFMMVYRRIKK